jgi:3'(2'), 5'-bisphosphate nucleotidase
VTAADEAAERLIVERLARLTPDVPIVAEEMVAAGRVPERLGGTFWLVDPLDGTREFVSRNGEFTVNIALVRDGRPALGVVHVPAQGLTYAGAGPGHATRRRGGGRPEPIACRPLPADGAVVLASRSHLTAETTAWLDGVKVKSLAQAGSAVKFCLVAAGEADLYPRLGRTMEWDTAAGHAVLLAAGGSVETLDGRPLGYGKPGLDNPHFIARGRPPA